ncbi:ferredoxin [Desulfohalotomaculum tongense]|uniref:indolepyruvate ferredoxin oxidoreductase subunit alpha n=1 Tax=Desulforadius tongensis TaxID=1216062 RepID=UPI0019561E98|nr:4Fe-4S dicluster domain-containing protein [Desulforadius tongensis]MBM7854833.1 ferredoxin [Desulforadius tongensis]
MFMVSIDVDKCEGCGACVDPCPATLLELVDGKAQVAGDAADCMGCETCVEVCPTGAATVQEV